MRDNDSTFNIHEYYEHDTLLEDFIDFDMQSTHFYLSTNQYVLIAHESISHKLKYQLLVDMNKLKSIGVALLLLNFETLPHRFFKLIKYYANAKFRHKQVSFVFVTCGLNSQSCKVYEYCIAILENYRFRYKYLNLARVNTDVDLTTKYMRSETAMLYCALHSRFRRTRIVNSDSEESDEESDDSDEEIAKKVSEDSSTRIGHVPPDCVRTILQYSPIDLWPALTSVNKLFFSITDEEIWRLYYRDLTGEYLEDYDNESFMRKCMNLSYRYYREQRHVSLEMTSNELKSSDASTNFLSKINCLNYQTIAQLVK
jgi:hypothetical protein